MTTAIKTVSLPEPNFPMVTRMVSHSLFPSETTGQETPVTWAISLGHPLVPKMRVVRMFILEDGDVEIYSLSDDGSNGMRNRVPKNRIRLVEEGMPLEVFVEELAAAEAESGGNDDDDEPDEPEAEEEPELPPVIAAQSAP